MGTNYYNVPNNRIYDNPSNIADNNPSNKIPPKESSCASIGCGCLMIIAGLLLLVIIVWISSQA